MRHGRPGLFATMLMLPVLLTAIVYAGFGLLVDDIPKLLWVPLVLISVLSLLGGVLVNRSATQNGDSNTQISPQLDGLIKSVDSMLWVFDVEQGKFTDFASSDSSIWAPARTVLDDPDSWLSVLHPDDTDEPLRLWSEIKAGRRHTPFSISYRVLTGDDGPEWARHSGVPIFGADGRIKRYIGMAIDCTAEMTYRRERAHLRQIILESDRLNSVGTLASGLAHDWNNLLFILAHEAVRLKDLRDSRLSNSTNAIDQVVSEGRAITDKLLNIARRNADTSASSNVYHETKMAIDLLSRALPNNVHIRFESSIPGEAVIPCDATVWHQIVLNLGINARDAIGKKIGTIKVSLTPANTPKTESFQENSIVLHVADNGRGMDEEQKRRALEPLFTTKMDCGGTGLGLSVVDSLVSDMNGALSIETSVGIGTSVSISVHTIRHLSPTLSAPNQRQSKGSGF